LAADRVSFDLFDRPPVVVGLRANKNAAHLAAIEGGCGTHCNQQTASE